MPHARESWTREENELTVASYLEMLALELRGLPYNKSEYRRALMPLIPARTEGAIERKHMNISAVLRDLHFPPIDGYKPYSNYQQDLLEEVVLQLERRVDILQLVAEQVETPARHLDINNVLGALVEVPEPLKSQPRAPIPWHERARRITPFADLTREARNVSLGSAGEDFVIAFERARLAAAGKDRLAARVEHVSRTRGPDVGFDILSFEENGAERLVEVKTTRYSRHTPFYVTRNEVLTSDLHASQYNLYRVFAFEREPKLFVLRGSVRATCSIDPTEYEARIR